MSTSRGWKHDLIATLLAAATTAAVTGGCHPTRPLITKMVGDRLVFTRSVSSHAYEHAARAMVYQEQGRYEEAAAELQRGLSYDHDAPELHARLAEVFIILERLQDAREEIQKSIAIEPTVVGLIARAHLFLARGEPSGAVVALKEAVALVNFDEDVELGQAAHLELAETQVMALRLDDAAATLTTLLQSQPSPETSSEAVGEAHFRLAAIHWAKGDLQAARTALQKLVGSNPGVLEGHLMLAWLSVAAGQTLQADEAFQTALSRSEGSLNVAALYARWLMGSGQESAAYRLADDLSLGVGDAKLFDENTFLERMELERVLRRPDVATKLAAELRATEPPPETLGRFLLAEGAVLAHAKRTEEAVAVFALVPEDAPAFRESRLRAAAVLRDAGETTRARALIAQAAGDALDDEGRLQIAVAQALVEEAAGDLVRAVRILDQLDPELAKSSSALLARAGIEERRGNWQEALRLAEVVLAHEPGDAAALNFWGFVAAEKGHRVDLALARVRAALVLEPASGAILDSVGWALLRAGKTAEASNFLWQAARVEAEDAEVLGHLATLQEKQQQTEAAITTLKKALAGSPEERIKRTLETHLRRLEAIRAADRRTP